MNRFFSALTRKHEFAYEGIPQDTTDALLIDLWLDMRPAHTQRAYRADIADLLDSTHKSIKQLDLRDLQLYAHQLISTGLGETSVARHLSATKSLLSFAAKTRYTPFNIGAALRLPKVTSDLAGRILQEEQMLKILSHEEHPRNHALLRLFYASGIRVSELCGLTWQDVQPNQESGQIRIVGKGRKERYILLRSETYQEVLALRGNGSADTPVFVSRKGGHLDTSQVRRIVKEAAKRAGVKVEGGKSRVSPHWLRHAHASHALDRGAPVSLVRDTLGHANIAVTNKYLHSKPSASSAQFLAV